MHGWDELGNGCGLAVERAYRTKVQQAALDIPWDVLEDKWEFAAMDAYGSVFVYTSEPTFYSEASEWFGLGKKLTGLLKLSNLPDPSFWKNTLTKRPAAEEAALTKGETAAIKEGIYGQWNRDDFLEWVWECSDIFYREDIREKLEDMDAPTYIQEYFKNHTMYRWYPYEVREALAAFY